MTGVHEAGDLIGGRYRIEAYIGKGGMQFVYRATDEVLGRQVALKTPQTTAAAKRFRQSAVVSSKVNHINVAKTLDFISDGDREYLIEELVVGSDLAAGVVGRYGQADPYLAAHIFHHLAKGVAASHSAGVIHRDLKPSNVIVCGEPELRTIKITDFGIAKLAEAELVAAAESDDITNSTSSTVQGAIPYMSPEAIRTPRLVTQSTDIWSLGAMMYQLVTGRLPFGQGLPAVIAIAAGVLPDDPEFLSRNAQFALLANKIMALAKKCMTVDALARPSANDLVAECGRFCYPLEPRFIGRVRSIKFRSWGFISHENGDVFFNLDSYFGSENLAEGDQVAFSKFPGGGAWRAHPLIKATPSRN